MGAMRHFDHDFVNDVMARLGRIRPDAKPRWGVLTPAGMIEHLADTIRYSMGRGGDLPDRSNWFMRAIAAPLVLNGIFPMLKNYPEPGYGKMRRGHDDLESFHALLEEYLSLVETGAMTPKRHFLFGDIGVDGWAKMHVVHFEHHLKQFGV